MNPHVSGIDISEYQETVNWDELFNNTSFVFIKATENTPVLAPSFVDPQFKRNQSEARRVGMPRGFYHFANAQRTTNGWNADDEADLFTNNVAAPQLGEWLILDWEIEFDDPVGWTTNWFMRVQQNTGSGNYGVIYMDVDRLNRFNWQPLWDLGVHLWIANPSNLPVKTWAIATQYGFTNVPGISGHVDGDVFNADNMDSFGHYGWQPPTPPTPPPAPTPAPGAPQDGNQPLPPEPAPLPPQPPIPAPEPVPQPEPQPTPEPTPPPAPKKHNWLVNAVLAVLRFLHIVK